MPIPSSVSSEPRANRGTRSVSRPSLTDFKVGTEDLDPWIGAPLRRLGPDAPDALRDRLRAEGEALLGASVPLVAAHHDLTMRNVLLGGPGAIGVVDWEGAEPQALPLGDLVYAVADAALAADGGSRLDAVRACFEPGGRHAGPARALVRHHARALGLGAPLVRLAFVASWLRHAGNEAEAVPPGPPRPFLDALRWVGEHPEAWAFDER